MRLAPALAALLLVPAAAAAGTARYGAEQPVPGGGPLDEAVLQAARARWGGGVAASAALTAAARRLAVAAAAGEPSPLSRARLRLALAEAGAFDPAPAAAAVCGPAARLAEQVAASLRPGPATHLGAAAAEGPDRACAVVLSAERRARLEPFPVELPAGPAPALRGALLGLTSPRVFATAPGGEAQELPASSGPGASFEARLPGIRPGRWLVEVLGSGPRGPEVAALLVIAAGGAPLAEPPRAAEEEPEELHAAEDRVAAAVNRLRARHGLAPVASDPRLREAARRHSADMLAAGTVAHVLPGGRGAAERLRRQRIPFRRALENLARAGSALAAHESIEESPAHLANLLDPGAARLGVGLARGRLPGGEPITYLTQLLVEPVDDSSDSRLRPEERVRLALWKERERLRAPALLADPRLDDLAAEAARAMLRAGALAQGDHAERALALGRKVAALDAFVAASPAETVRSTNLPSPRFRRVGVGIAIGDSPTYGAGLLWIAVLYTD